MGARRPKSIGRHSDKIKEISGCVIEHIRRLINCESWFRTCAATFIDMYRVLSENSRIG
jgi:hypothetical protein